MELKTILPVDGAARSAAISKYAPNREGGNRGRRQRSSDSEKPKPEQKRAKDLDNFFAGVAAKPVNGLSDFELLLKTMWEDNQKMQESAKALEQTSTEAVTSAENAWIWGIKGNYRPVIKK